MMKPRTIHLDKVTHLALVTVIGLALAGALTGGCVEKVGPCAEFDAFAEIYVGTCPEVEAWATSCASNLDELLPEVRQDLDWCVDCYQDYDADPGKDCTEAPLGASCGTLLNTTLDASCTWPQPQN